MMNLEIYQYIVPLISLVFLIRIAIQYSGRRRSVLSTVVWTFFWLVVAVLAFAPHILSVFLADILGFRNNVHAVLFLGLGLALLIIFYLSSVVDKLESKLSDLVRTIAIQNAEMQEKEKVKKETTKKS